MEMKSGSFKIIIGRNDNYIKDNISILIPAELHYEKLVFSGGEIQIKLDQHLIECAQDRMPITIFAHLIDSEKIMELYMLIYTIRDNAFKAEIKLICPYFPYARQDRIMTNGEGLAVRAMAKLINSLEFSEVEIWDPHSDVTSALINNLNVVHQVSFVKRIQNEAINERNVVLVSPDAGAMKKVQQISESLFNWPIVVASKVRNVKTGDITGTEVRSEHIGNKNFLICDDLCDGGRTFIELAKVLRPLTNGKIYLYVTHGIFSKGLKVFDSLIDHIYCAMPFPNVEESSLFTRLNIKIKY